jgi:hypothetical protein
MFGLSALRNLPRATKATKHTTFRRVLAGHPEVRLLVVRHLVVLLPVG